MLIIPTLMFLIYLISTYLFDRLRMALIVLTIPSGLALLLNDWNNTVVDDSTTKLVFILSFVLYSLMVLYNVFVSKSEN
jgi:hypothetical protein